LIYGAAGTGKSTLINHISNFFNDEDKIYLANTNPAIDNLKRKVTTNNGEFMTIAKFLHNGNIKTKCGILIIDECSMVSNSDMKSILDKSEFELLVLVGDVYQIESIRFGNWFNIANSFIPKSLVYELKNLYRTNNDNLLKLWERVRKFEPEILESLVKNGYTSKLDESIFENSNEEQIILCLNYGGLYGINNINKFMQQSNPNPPIQWGTNSYKVNDPILFNELSRFHPLIYNNMKGEIISIEILLDKIQFDVKIDKVINKFQARDYDFELVGLASDGKSIIRFTVNRYKSTDEDDDYNSNAIVPFQVAYAVSIHKAQGLEYQSVKIIITKEIDELITHNIFYTAITRTKERLKIYWTPETEQKILNSFKPKNNIKDIALIKAKYNL